MNTSVEQARIQTSRIIHDRGWRQGSFLEDVDANKISLPFALDKSNEHLIICTQSCTVVSPRFEVDPLIEVIVAKRLESFNPKSMEAVGKNQRKIHLKLISGDSSPAIECDINRRTFFDRKQLGSFSPSNNLILANGESQRLAVWLGRSYMRIALPNVLVERLRQLFPIILDILKRKEIGNDTFHDHVSLIYFRWEPNENSLVDPPDLFKVSFIFVCRDPVTSEKLDLHFSEKLSAFIQEGGFSGVQIIGLKCQADNEIFLSDLNGYDRLSEWDYLTNFNELSNI